MTDFLELSRRILLDPGGTMRAPDVALIIREQSSEHFADLHPLAGGLALLERDGVDADVERLQELYREGLYGCFVSAIIEMDCGGSVSYATGSERVNHQVEVLLAGRSIVLDFESTGQMWMMGVQAHRHYPVELDVLLANATVPLASPKALHNWWVQTRGRVGPFAYPEDSGGQIGGPTWKLTKIGGLPVDGPTILDVNVGWEEAELSSDYRQRRDYRWNPRAFCLLHYLEEDQARALGLARPEGTVWRPKREADVGYYPDWVADHLDLEASWITRDQLIESYGGSTQWFDELTVFVGASETAWSVEREWSTPIEHLGEEWREHWTRFQRLRGCVRQEMQPVRDAKTFLRRLDRLFAFRVRAANAKLPPDLCRVIANLLRLRQAALGEGAPD